MEIKQLNESYKEKIRQLYVDTFKEDGPEFVEHYFNTYMECENVIGMLENEELVCMLHRNPYQVMWQGQLYNTNYIVAVATNNEHRRKGYMRQLLDWMLQEGYKAGDVFSLLMPIDSRYYDQFGYGFIQDVTLFKFKYSDLGNKVLSRLANKQSVPTKELCPDDSIQLLPIYNQYKRQFDLSHNRGMRALDTLIREADSEGGKVVVVPDGYVIYYPSEKSVFVRESAYTSTDGFYNILAYVGAVAGEKLIEWQMPTQNPLKHLVSHKEGHTRTNKPFMMARIINVQEMLTDMAATIGDCVIKVTDGQIFENNGVYRISGGSVERITNVGATSSVDMNSKNERMSQDAGVVQDVTIDVESLAQWLFGYESLENLAFGRDSVVIHREVIYYPELAVVNYFNEFV